MTKKIKKYTKLEVLKESTIIWWNLYKSGDEKSNAVEAKWRNGCPLCTYSFIENNGNTYPRCVHCPVNWGNIHTADNRCDAGGPWSDWFRVSMLSKEAKSAAALRIYTLIDKTYIAELQKELSIKEDILEVLEQL